MADEVLDYTFMEFGQLQTQKIIDKFVAATERLSLMPFSGQVEAQLEGMNHEYRYILINPELKLLYYVEDKIVVVAAIWNVRQSGATVSLRLGD